MRIVVNDIAASSGGALTVLKEFYKCIRENDTGNEWIFLLCDNWIEETDNIKIITLPAIKNSRINKLKFDLFTGKNYIQELKPDVVISLQNIVTFGLKVPQIVYIHQSIPFQKVKKFSFLKSSERSLAVYQYLIGAIIRRSVKKSTRVIVQTDWIKDAVCKQCRIPSEKVVKITPNVKAISALIDDTSFDSSRFFYPTADAVYKNNSCIFEACKMLDKEKLNYCVTLTLPPEQTSGNVYCVGRLNYEDVIQNYHKSTLVFPSYIESFGYPLAEARKAGSVVLASDCPFSRELLFAYENAYFFDPFKPQELAELMKKVIRREISRQEVKADEEETVDSWKQVLSQILELGNS